METDSLLETLALLGDAVGLERLEEAQAAVAQGETTTRNEMAEIIQRRRRHDRSS
jgi:hypothetical protein